jgi:hypothetical protein
VNDNHHTTVKTHDIGPCPVCSMTLKIQIEFQLEIAASAFSGQPTETSAGIEPIGATLVPHQCGTFTPQRRVLRRRREFEEGYDG